RVAAHDLALERQVEVLAVTADDGLRRVAVERFGVQENAVEVEDRGLWNARQFHARFKAEMHERRQLQSKAGIDRCPLLSLPRAERAAADRHPSNGCVLRSGHTAANGTESRPVRRRFGAPIFQAPSSSCSSASSSTS